ncbi:hypothetical protein [Burkholderia contaminans]|uniref:Uncharacterized protein n=1 Tax=Burkholderia contaminans TaxID=488447 RepID=A0A2S5DMJ6_9BURK|nr:hypothetical protein [Burkholderia contaminans]POZ80260.1 hypothetical protein C3743_40530 [Burkholderia contaminans]POZ80292.1 hypothetical protein C3743_39455 [Burkholderia contaminans]
MNEITFTYGELTRHVEIQVGAFMAQAKGSKSRREREAFENQAKGVVMAWASLVYKPVIGQGDAAHAAHNDDYARMLGSVGLPELAAAIRTSGIRWAWEQALDVIDRVQSSGRK